MTIQAVQQTLVDDFAIFDDWMGRYEYVIDLGKQVPEKTALKAVSHKCG